VRKKSRSEPVREDQKEERASKKGNVSAEKKKGGRTENSREGTCLGGESVEKRCVYVLKEKEKTTRNLLSS